MTSSFRGSLPLIGAAWLSLTLFHAVLQLLSTRGVLSDPMLPGWARLSLLCTEFFALAILVAAAALPFLKLAAAIERAGPGPQRLLRAARILLLLLLLLAVWSSWSMFWLSGRFLDRGGLQFVLRNVGAVYGSALQSSPFLALGMPFAIFAAAIVAGEAVPAWAKRLSDRVHRTLERVAGALLGLAVLIAAAGEVAIRTGTAEVEDPRSHLLVRRSEVYSALRQETAGPLTHLAAWTLGRSRGDLFENGTPAALHLLYLEQSGRLVRKPRVDPLEEGPPEEGVVLVRRPVVPMEQYLSTVDRAALRRWNVVVILIDSFRADQLRATGGTREVMPGLEALAKEGRSYPDCYTQASHTDYAAPSVFSSHHPLRARFVHRYPPVPGYPRVMIYDVLKALGWRTAFFSSQNEDWAGMLNYYQTGGLETVFHPQLPKLPAELLATRERYTGSLDDAVTISEAIRWTEADPQAPFFLYLNLQNAHLPFRIPDSFPRRFGPSKVEFTITAGSFPPEKVDVVKEIYADSLAYVDAQMDRLFHRLKERGLWDRTLIVVTGDHGESFFEHGAPAHANGIYEQEMRVPLVLRAPGLEPLRDPRPAQLIDVAPGIFHLLGLPIHPSFQGIDLVGPPPRPDRIRALISQTGWKTYLGAVRSGFKLIRNGQTGGAVLYDLPRDPGERTDVSASHPDVVKELRSWLKTWRWAQIEYYENPARWSREYPPVVGER